MKAGAKRYLSCRVDAVVLADLLRSSIPDYTCSNMHSPYEEVRDQLYIVVFCKYIYTLCIIWYAVEKRT